MSGKIKSKDLSYDASLPPFLQRLHDQKAGRGGDEDRHEREIARPRKIKNPNDDDGPTVIDESGENVSKEEYERLTNQAVDDANGAVKEIKGTNVTGKSVSGGPTISGALPAEDEEDSESRRPKAAATDTAPSRKRKVGKVIGGDAEEADDEEKGKQEESGEKKIAKKAKKKAKPVKLAFQDDEET